MAADELRWAGRVPQHKIRRLYTLDAQGIEDGDLVDDVGYSFLARCEAIRTVTEAHAGRVACPACTSIIERELGKDQTLLCRCGWTMGWRLYHKSYRGKQLVGGGAVPAFHRFIDEWPRARSYRDKLLVIDRLIHGLHDSGKSAAARPAGVNVIGGTIDEVTALIQELAYSSFSTPGLRDEHDRWLCTTDGTWWRNRLRS